MVSFSRILAPIPRLSLIGYRKTNLVTLTISLTTPSTYTLTAARPAGSKPSFTFDSSTGLIN